METCFAGTRSGSAAAKAGIGAFSGRTTGARREPQTKEKRLVSS
jgi:hypothetical protein